MERKHLTHPISRSTAFHLCVDMQRMFAEETAWKTPWMGRVLPVVESLVAPFPTKTCFTRFIPARKAGDGEGTWRGYYERWSEMTLARLGDDMIGLLPALARFVPPALVFDKRVYSPWHGGKLHTLLRQRSVDTLVISGGETDVCVLSTVLGAVDYGYRVILVTDALCSSSDETHDALLMLYERRYNGQVETAEAADVLQNWTP